VTAALMSVVIGRLLLLWKWMHGASEMLRCWKGAVPSDYGQGGLPGLRRAPAVRHGSRNVVLSRCEHQEGAGRRVRPELWGIKLD
jgi:hypothetical protein